MLIFLLGFHDWSEVTSSRYWGAVWENAVIAEARKKRCQIADSRPLWFWRTASGDEIDLLMETGPEEFIAIEVKASPLPTNRDAGAFDKFTALHGEGSLKEKILCCRTDQKRSLTQGSDIHIAPIWSAF